MKYTLPEEARQYVLFQRTDLLPKRPRQKRLRRVLVKLGVLDDGYEDFVRNCAVSEGELIDEQYFRAMRDNANSLLPSIRSDTSSILDIGCGIAALDIFLYEPLNEPKLYLLDKTAIDPKVWY
ncbi:MAG: hypothetical protein KDJ29_14120, partial [Hyphomicrobiales bacterium]|nr:hypothetical protein [Hyphomicrobiales bacterium]